MAGKSCDFLSRSFRQLHVNPSCQSLSYLPCVSGFCWPLFLRYSVVHDNIPYHLTPKPIPFSSIAWLVIAISSSFVHVRIAGFPPYRFLLFSDFYLIIFVYIPTESPKHPAILPWFVLRPQGGCSRNRAIGIACACVGMPKCTTEAVITMVKSTVGSLQE